MSNVSPPFKGDDTTNAMGGQGLTGGDPVKKSKDERFTAANTNVTRYERDILNALDAANFSLNGKHLEGESLIAAIEIARHAEEDRRKRRRWIPVVISVLALVVMIADLYLKATQQLPLIRR